MFGIIKNAFAAIKKQIAKANAALKYASEYQSRVQSEVDNIKETKIGNSVSLPERIRS